MTHPTTRLSIGIAVLLTIVWIGALIVTFGGEEFLSPVAEWLVPYLP